MFSVEAPKIKFGNGVLNELGEDAKSLGMRRVAVFTDRIVAEQESLGIAVKSLEKAGMECEIYNGTYRPVIQSRLSIRIRRQIRWICFSRWRFGDGYLQGV